MNFTVKIIADSCHGNARLTTFQLSYPRFIHAEFMTHRVFSRNASSSRAIPVETMLEQVRTNPAHPEHWGANQKGMQAAHELDDYDKKTAQLLWQDAANAAADIAEKMKTLGLHKQVANRILEPFQHINVVVTASSYDNFFELRCHPDAQPEIRILADMMRAEFDKSVPRKLNEDDVHLPYVRDEEFGEFDMMDLIKFSVARCARVSYLTHDKQNPIPENDIALYDRLVGSVPLHASPAEHQARPAICEGMSGNFDSRWDQFRKFLELGRAEEFANERIGEIPMYNTFGAKQN